MKRLSLPTLNHLWSSRLQASAGGNRSLLEIGKEDPIFVDRFRALRAKFEYKSGMMKTRLVGVTSSIAGEGKTLTCARLAYSLSMTGRHNVLLVDTDIRKADLSHGLNFPRNPGLADYLMGTVSLAEIVRNTNVPALKLITAGSVVNSPADLLSREAFRSFLREVRDRFDIVLLDTPPILPVADTLTMREQLDGFVFLFRVSYTPAAMFRQAMEDLGENKVLGVVINGIEPKEQKYIDKYYGHYYQKPTSGIPGPQTGSLRADETAQKESE